MNWRRIEFVLVEFFRKDGALLDQSRDSGDVTVVDADRLNLTELAKELEEQLR